MTYRELTMIDVRELVRRAAVGQSDRRIAREAGTDRKPIARYRQVASGMGLADNEPLTDALVHEIA